MAGIIHRTQFPVGSSPDSIQWDIWNEAHGFDDGAGGVLTFGAIADGEYLKRDGATIVGGTPSGGGLLSETLHLTASQIATLASGGPYEVIPAPGVGLAVVPTLVVIDFKYESTWYWRDGTAMNIALAWDGNDNDGVTVDFLWPGSGNPIGRDRLGTAIPSALGVTADKAENLPLLWVADFDPTPWSRIVTSVVAVGGAGYAIGDTGIIDFGDSNPGTLDVDAFAEYEIDTVDGGGAVLTYHITNPADHGPIYDTTVGRNPVATDATSGAGAGFTVNVTAVTPNDGDLFVTVYYVIEELH